MPIETIEKKRATRKIKYLQCGKAEIIGGLIPEDNIEAHRYLMNIVNLPNVAHEKGFFAYSENKDLAGNAQITLFMNDVHYYLADFCPDYPCMMYITGCDFYPIPGFYNLPAGEGDYVLSAKPDYSGSIGMRT